MLLPRSAPDRRRVGCRSLVLLVAATSCWSLSSSSTLVPPKNPYMQHFKHVPALKTTAPAAATTTTTTAAAANNNNNNNNRLRLAGILPANKMSAVNELKRNIGANRNSKQPGLGIKNANNNVHRLTVPQPPGRGRHKAPVLVPKMAAKPIVPTKGKPPAPAAKGNKPAAALRSRQLKSMKGGTKPAWITMSSKNFSLAVRDYNPNRARGESIRLPRHLTPIHYDVALVPWLDDRNFTFDGEIGLTFTCVQTGEACSNITLHAKEMSIADISVTAENGDPIEINNVIEYDPYAEWMVIHTLQPIPTGANTTVRISYSGTMGESYRGLFYRSYVEDTGATKYFAATQCQPHWGRLVFPSLDEPSMKATYTVVIGRRKDRQAYSNMPLAKSEAAPDLHDDYYLDTFETTPVPMSNYLLVAAVGEYEFVQSDRDRRHQILFKPGRRPWASYSLDLVVDALDFFEGFHGIRYVLPKLGHIAVDDFGGAMENFGLITYDESVLLADPNDPNIAEKRKEIYLYVTHEIAHQWTGNLVTTDWWDTIWLNEGITEFFTYFAGGKIDPDSSWEAVLAVAVMNRAIAMDADPQGLNLPLYSPVETPEDFVNVFDFTRIYEKGACVTRMISTLFTLPTFQKAIQHYLISNAYSTVQETHLWQALEQAADEDGTQPGWDTVKNILTPWSRQAGVPLVTVTRDYQTNYAYFSQERFINVTRNEHEYTEKWPIFISFSLQDGTRRKGAVNEQTSFFLSDTDVQVDLFLGPANDTVETWLLANPLRGGYYIVNYDSTNWVRLLAQMSRDPTAIDPINRGQILSDLLILCYVELVETDVCHLVPIYLVTESHPVAWVAAAQLLPAWRGSHLYTNAEYDTMLPRMIAMALGNVRNVQASQTIAGHAKRGPALTTKAVAGKHGASKKQVVQTERILSGWADHLMAHGMSSRFVPEILRVVERRSKIT